MERITTNWTFKRALFLVIGIIICVQFILTKQWIGTVFGAYYVLMGLLGFGCAGGSCAGGACDINSIENKKMIN